MPKYDYRLPKHDITNELVHIDNLEINPNAQRALDTGRAKRMANNFLPQAAGTLVVCRRDGKNYVVDGQHRLAAARMAGVTTMTCEIHHGLSQQHEAELFLINNKESKPPTKYDEYRIGLIAEHPLFVETQQVLDKHGLRMAPGPTTNAIGAISAVTGIVQTHGADILDASLTVLERAFGRHEATWEGTMLHGVATFIHRHLSPPTEDALQQLGDRLAIGGSALQWKGKVLASATEFGTQQTGSRTRSAAAYRLVVAAWNKGRPAKHRIPLRDG